MVAFFFVLTILINEVMPAPSNAPEWVEIYNTGPDAVDISGWYVDDDTLGGTQIVVPADTIIEPAALYIITLSSAIFNNTGDAVTLYNADGRLIDRIDFGSMKNTESISRIPDGSTIIIKAPPSPGKLNAPATSTPLPHTATSIIESTTTPATEPPHTATSIIESTTTPATEPPHTATSIIESTTTPATEPPLTVTPSETHTTPPTKTSSITRTPSPSMTESPTRTPSLTKTPSQTRTPSLTKTPSQTRTPSLTKTPSQTRTPSLTKTPSQTRTPSLTKTPSHTPRVSSTRTPSLTRTQSPTKTQSRTRTPSISKTPRPSRTSKSTRTPSASKTPRITRTPDGAPPQEQHSGSESAASTPMLAIHGRAATPQVVVCPPAPSTLDRWSLSATGHQITLPDSTTCVTIELPADPPAIWSLTNPHGMIVATIDVFAQYCAHDISDCQPSPTMMNMVIHVDYQRPFTPTIVATATSGNAAHTNEATVQIPMQTPSTTTPSTIPLGMLLMLGGWIALKVLARPAPDVLYSESGEDATSSADSLPSESRKV